MVEVNAGMDQRGILENTLPDPIAPLRSYQTAMYFIAPVMVLLAWLVPQYALVYGGLTLAVLVGWGFARKRIRIEEEDYQELFKSRADLSLAVPPIHPEDAAIRDADLKLPREKRKGTWVRQRGPSGTPEIVTEEVHRPDGTTGTMQVWRYRLQESSRPACLAMAKYLKEQCPSVYRLVVTWWQELHADKVTGQIWVGKRYQDLDAGSQAEVRQRCEFELFQGVFIGLRPDTWGKRFDRRPYYRTFYELRSRLARMIPEPEKPTAAVIDGAPWPETFRVKWIYNGVGFTIDEEIAAKYYFQKFRKLQPAKAWLKKDQESPAILHNLPVIGKWSAARFRSVRSVVSSGYRKYKSLMFDASQDTGSRWILGLGWRQFERLWVHYDRDMPQHSIVGGGSGYGKTVLMQNPVIQAIYNYSALVWLDPKVDKSTVSLIVHHAYLAGRMDDLVMLSVSRSDCAYNSTMNPLGGYFDPSQIGNILAGLMPESAGDNQYFLDDARNIGRIVGTSVHWIGQYLTMLSGGDEVCRHPPRLLLWLEYARVLNLHEVDARGNQGEFVQQRAERVSKALQEFDGVWERLRREDRNFLPRDTAEKSLYAMWLQAEYTARYWRLNFSHLLEFALNNRQRLVSWIMRIVYPHVCARDERFQDPLFPKFDTLELVSGYVQRGARPPQADEKPKPTLLQLYEQSGPHILSRDGLAIADRTSTMWAYLYERIINVEEVGKLQFLLVRKERSFAELIGQAKRDPEEYGQGVANLRPVVQEIVAGEKYDVLCVPEPDLTWPKIHQEKKIVLLILGSMSDQKASDAVSKAFVQSLLGYCGHIQDRGAQDLDLTFCGDEFLSWATPAWAHIVDKCRSTGVRTMVACQSEAGMRYALKSPDLFKHIVASVRLCYTCTTSSTEDHKSFTEGIRKINIYTPVRTLGESPTQKDDGKPGVNFNAWGTTENWQFTPQPQPLVDPEMLGWLPKGCFFRRIQGEFAVFQAPLLKPAPFLFHDLVGLTDYGSRPDQRRVLVEGVDYSVDSTKDTSRMATWASDDRLAAVFGRENTVNPDFLPMGDAKLVDGYRLIPMTADELLASTGSLDQASVASDVDAGLPDVGEQVLQLPLSASANGGTAAANLDLDVGWDPDGDNDLRVEAAASIDAVGKEHGLTASEVTENGVTGRGAIDANGKRFGCWHFFQEGGTIPHSDGFYVDGLQHGEWNERDASGQILHRHLYEHGRLVANQVVTPPVAEEVPIPPGPLPKPTLTEVVDHDGFRFRGLQRGDTRVGMWEVFRPDGTRSEIQHFDMHSGNPTGLWERYDNTGDLIETYSPVA